MYSKKEHPIIRATIYYYDTQYSPITSYSVLRILKKYHFYPPHKFYAGKLTNNRFIKGNNCDNTFIQAYSELDILEVDMSSADSRHTADYWRVNWGFTFHKNSKLAIQSPKFIPWNILTIDSTYGRLNDSHAEEEFLLCVKELICLIDPFLVSIDDVNNKVELMDQVRETAFVPDRIQQIFWFNYWRNDILLQYKNNVLWENSKENIEEFHNGIIVILSDRILNFDTDECKINRKKIRRYLG